MGRAARNLEAAVVQGPESRLRAAAEDFFLEPSVEQDTVGEVTLRAGSATTLNKTVWCLGGKATATSGSVPRSILALPRPQHEV